MDYTSDNCTVGYCSDLHSEEAEALVGKTIKYINAKEYHLELIFDDGSSLEVSGSRWDGCSLGADYFETDDKP
jgi:hypothetical protein